VQEFALTGFKKRQKGQKLKHFQKNCSHLEALKARFHISLGNAPGHENNKQ